MQLIQDNPYRIIGLLVGATAAQQQRQINRLKKYIEAEQEPEKDNSFPILGVIERNIEIINKAASDLTSDNEKMTASLFWFYNGNSITDEPAFEFLIDNNENEARNIWTKLCSTEIITNRNASAFFNLSTLFLNEFFNDPYDNFELLEKSIQYKLKFLQSDFSISLIEKATDSTYKISKIELQLLFLNSLFKELESLDSISINELLKILSTESFLAKDEFLKSSVDNPIKEIEQKIEEYKLKRKTNKSAGYKNGGELYSFSKDRLKLISDVLGSTNVKFTTISDKVADEILQIGIDYFSYYRDTETDPGEKTMRIFRASKSLAIGKLSKQRCQEQIDNLQNWIDDEPERTKTIKVKENLDKLIEVFNIFEDKIETIFNAKIFINRCIPELNSIKNELGGNDELTKKLTERVANQTLSYVIEDINKMQKNFTTSMNTYDPILGSVMVFDNVVNYKSAISLISEFQTKVDDAKEVIKLIKSINPGLIFFGNRLIPNEKVINNLKNDLDELYYKFNKTSTTPNSNNSKTNITGSRTNTKSTNKSTSSSADTSFSDVFPFILGAIGLIIGIAAGAGWASIVLALIGIGIGSKLTGN